MNQFQQVPYGLHGNASPSWDPRSVTLGFQRQKNHRLELHYCSFHLSQLPQHPTLLSSTTQSFLVCQPLHFTTNPIDISHPMKTLFSDEPNTHTKKSTTVPARLPTSSLYCQNKEGEQNIGQYGNHHYICQGLHEQFTLCLICIRQNVFYLSFFKKKIFFFLRNRQETRTELMKSIRLKFGSIFSAVETRTIGNRWTRRQFIKCLPTTR